MLDILPMAHMYGMAVEFLFGFCYGMHLYFLNRLPSPAIIAKAFADVRPTLVVSVPLVIEKIIRKKVFPVIQSNRMRLLLSMPVVSIKVKERICQQVYEAFGGRAYEIIVGGAALSKEVEQFLMSINFPVTVGYGATECAPLISYNDWKDHVAGSCGKAVDNMEVCIDSKDPRNVAGEILTRGTHVMLGYYKNEEATRQVLDSDGWYHTGDLGTMDERGNIFIRGRIKNMLLGQNGQNIYPEEIEDKLNSMPMVGESVIIQHGEKLVALVYPDHDDQMSFSREELEDIMEQNRKDLNPDLPSYAQLSGIKIMDKEFEKTPKRNIRRFLYTNTEI
jgi:long-chain acyl-CoA synthetase